MEVKGTLSLTANSDGANKCKVMLASADLSGLFTFQTHPKVCGNPSSRGVFSEFFWTQYAVEHLVCVILFYFQT